MDPVTLSAVGWGVSIAGWIMSPIVTRLVNKAFLHIQSGGAMENLKELVTHTIPQLKLTLEAAEASQHKELLQDIVRGLKCAFYDVEDILDEVEYNRLSKQLQKNKRRKSIQDDGAGISNQVVGLTGPLSALLKEKMKNIKELIGKSQNTISLTGAPSSKGSAEQRPNVTTKYMTTTSHSADKVTGRDQHRDKIINMLHDTCSPSTGVGIHGLPGSGKTTLAQYVCEFEKHDGHFDIVIWIHVTESFSVNAIYKEMFEAASESKTCPESNSLDCLQGELEKKLDKKRVLLILDDVWRTKDVGQQQLPELFSPIRKVGKEGSKILVTTRNKEALFDLGPGVTCNPYPIPDLDEKEFLQLFMYHALGSAADQGTSILQEIGAEIAKKLKRLPLAAKTVGGHLRRTKDVQSWITVRDSDILEHTGALWWSYQHLDEHVRRCFAYCSIFPRRFQLDRDMLVKLWVAEGFINMVNPKKEMEDVGREYFDELVATSFLQLGTKEHKKDKDYYLIHDLMHDLAEEVAGSDCCSIQYGLTTTREIPKDVRHLFVEDVRDFFADTNTESSPIIDKIVKLEKLRTLIIDSSVITNSLDPGEISAEDLNKMFTGLRKLRVLVVKTSFIQLLSVPDSIGTAKHLRYLAIGGDFTYNSEPDLTFPSTLSKLYHLQVLDFGGDAYLRFPCVEDMVNLINLRHVIGYQECGFPTKGNSLQTIPPFYVSGFHNVSGPRYELEHLGNLSRLEGKLEIHRLGYAVTKNEALKANLAAKERLTKLVLAWDDDDNWDEPDDQAEVLEGLCPPVLLERLKIVQYEGPRYPSWMMCKQNKRWCLLKLTLSWCSRLEAISDSGFFVHLQSLCLSSCDWKALPDNMEQLKNLKKLKITDCCNIRSLPTLPRTLEYFLLYGCHEVFHESCKTREDPNFQKLEHVTNKVMGQPQIESA